MTSALEFAAMAALLRQGRILLALSLALLVVALMAMLLVDGTRLWPWAGSLMVALMQAYYAMRVGLDAHLFDALARDCDAASAGTRLDAALLATGLRHTAAPDRAWPSRFAGARGLLVRQATCLVLQAAALAWACWR